MAIAFSTIIIASGAYTYAKSRHIEPKNHTTVVNLPDLPPPPKEKDKIIEHAKAEPAPATKALPAAPTIKYTVPHITPKEVDTDMPTIKELDGAAVGTLTSKGDGGQVQAIDAGLMDNPGGTGTEPVVDVNMEYKSVEMMPEPDGGVAGWSKFLNKNLRYPYQAQEEGKSGRVFVSFVVERDGHLTDITVVGKAGYGMDEEAIRVLKLAKNWRPGRQNGTTVRVRYSIPINFVLTE
ncbi:MAG: TonB family protein [Mucilaginibacter sp.]|nr:TonB family protein [Mucilaginibacter sp.]